MVKGPQWANSSDCEKQSLRVMWGYLRLPWWRLLFLRCFSFVLIRHSQLCWLRGWFYCEIISLIKRSSSHEKVCVIKKPSIGSPPLSFLHLFPLTVENKRRNRVAWSVRAAHFISILSALTHLGRWKTVTVICEAVATQLNNTGVFQREV